MGTELTLDDTETAIANGGRDGYLDSDEPLL